MDMHIRMFSSSLAYEEELNACLYKVANIILRLALGGHNNIFY